jgi:hypothetical protein
MVDDWMKWLGLLSLILSIGNIVWAWISRPARDLGKRIDDVEDQTLEELKKHDRRIQRVEDEMRHMPTKDDLQKVQQQNTAIKTELDIVARVVNRIDDFLRSGK